MTLFRRTVKAFAPHDQGQEKEGKIEGKPKEKRPSGLLSSLVLLFGKEVGQSFFLFKLFLEGFALLLDQFRIRKIIDS